MYMCENCGGIFSEPIVIKETHGFSRPPYECFDACPYCKDTNIVARTEEGEEDD